MKLGAQEQIALALVTYPILAATLAVLTRDPYAALTTAYILALIAREFTINYYTRTLLIVSSLAVIPLTPLLITPSRFTSTALIPSYRVETVTVEKTLLPLHTLLVYRDPHTGTETHVLALDWGQLAALTILAELYSIRKAKKRESE